MGFTVLAAAWAALAATFEPGPAAAWGRIGLALTAASIAVAAALQAVDGVALKMSVDRWAAATGDARAHAYEAAVAVRQIEIGLASLLSVVSGFTSSVFALAIFFSTRYPAWLGAIGLLGGLGTVAAGASQAAIGFSGFAMTLSMVASSILLIWFILGGILLWRLAPRLPA